MAIPGVTQVGSRVNKKAFDSFFLAVDCGSFAAELGKSRGTAALKFRSDFTPPELGQN
jgi:hypothetical protein